MTKRLFRQEHPVLLGFLILGLIVAVFWGGITFFLFSVTRPHGSIFPARPGIGIIDLSGPIFKAEEIIQTLQDFRRDTQVSAVILRIDSPGGVVGASQEIYQEVKRTNAVKPVVASMASIAASGGYYAALGAGHIVANPGTLTGSIGVILKFANLEELFDKIGFKSQVIKSGELKDIGSADRPMTEHEKALLQSLIDNVHQQFITAVVESRKLSIHAVTAIADGRILSGEQAKEHGLIDQLGNLTDAVTLAAKLAGIDDEDPLLIYPEEDESFFAQLISAKTASWLNGLFSGGVPLLLYQWNSPR